MRKLVMPGLWAASTVVATALAWAAVSLVAAGVTDRPPPVLPHSQVVAALGEAFTVSRRPAASAGDDAVVGIASKASRSPSTSAPRPATKPAAAPPIGGRPASPPGGASASASGSSGVSAATQTGSSGSTPETESSSPTSTAPPSSTVTRTFATQGGSVTASCRGSAISLVAATPQDGYGVTVPNAGPEEVEVHFTSNQTESEVRASCVNGQPTLDGGDGG